MDKISVTLLLLLSYFVVKATIGSAQENESVKSEPIPQPKAVVSATDSATTSIDQASTRTLVLAPPKCVP